MQPFLHIPVPKQCRLRIAAVPFIPGGNERHLAEKPPGLAPRLLTCVGTLRSPYIDAGSSLVSSFAEEPVGDFSRLPLFFPFILLSLLMIKAKRKQKEETK